MQGDHLMTPNIKSEQVKRFSSEKCLEGEKKKKKRTEGCWDQVVESKGVGQTARVHVVLCDL